MIDEHEDGLMNGDADPPNHGLDATFQEIQAEAQPYADKVAVTGRATPIAEFSATAAALAELADRYKGVIYDVRTKEGMETARKGRAELRGLRTSLEEARKAAKADIVRRGKLIDSEARRITEALSALEQPIAAQIKAEEDRVAAEREARIRAERERVEAEARAKLEAEQAAERARIEAERAEMERMRAELARQREEIQRERAEREAREAEVRRKIEEEERAARLRIEEQERAARLAREEEERKVRAAREAEEQRLRAERQRIEEERMAAEASARAARAEQERLEREERLRQEEAKRAEEAKARALLEAEEARQREIARRAAEIDDGYAVLAMFVARFGHRDEFAPMVYQINVFLSQREASVA